MIHPRNHFGFLFLRVFILAFLGFFLMAIRIPLAYTQDNITKDPCPDRMERAADDGNEVHVILSSSAIVLSFLATFDENDKERTTFWIDSVQVERTEVDCIPGKPCN